MLTQDIVRELLDYDPATGAFTWKWRDIKWFKADGKNMLKVSDDFKVPDTPAPTWRVIDSKGNVYTLDAFKIKDGNGEKRQVVVPAYVQDIVTVQVYCAWAQVLLGEAKFAGAVK